MKEIICVTIQLYAIECTWQYLGNILENNRHVIVSWVFTEFEFLGTTHTNPLPRISPRFLELVIPQKSKLISIWFFLQFWEPWHKLHENAMLLGKDTSPLIFFYLLAANLSKKIVMAMGISISVLNFLWPSIELAHEIFSSLSIFSPKHIWYFAKSCLMTVRLSAGN